MNIIVRAWRQWKFGHKFRKLGKDCLFTGQVMEIHGHVEAGDHCRFRNNVILRTKGEGRIIFGDYSGCSFNCIIEATKMVKIGRFTGIAENTVIRDTNHLVIGTDVHWRLTPHIAEPIIIGESVLIMSGCYIAPGVTIGDGAVVGQGSVVTKDIGPYEVWHGNPARKIAHRTQGVPESMRQRYVNLLQQYGLKESRYGYADDEVREAAASGRNRAAEERDQIIGSGTSSEPGNDP